MERMSPAEQNLLVTYSHLLLNKRAKKEKKKDGGRGKKAKVKRVRKSNVTQPPTRPIQSGSREIERPQSGRVSVKNLRSAARR